MAVDAAEAAQIRSALVRLRRTTGLPVAFGGLVESGRRQVRISELSGTATTALSALAVTAGNGLGGRAVALSRPCAVTDYSVSRQISHEYDLPVAAEGLRSVLAVPVVVRRRVRGVLYGALRSAQPLGDRTLGAAVAAARDAEQALVLRDEADELLAAASPPSARTPAAPDPAGGAAWEQVREAHAALRALAPRIADPALRDELLRACGLLAAGDDGPAPGPGWRRARWTCWPAWPRARRTGRRPSGSGWVRRPSRAICARRCASWAPAPARRPSRRPAGRGGFRRRTWRAWGGAPDAGRGPTQDRVPDAGRGARRWTGCPAQGAGRRRTGADRTRCPRRTGPTLDGVPARRGPAWGAGRGTGPARPGRPGISRGDCFRRFGILLFASPGRPSVMQCPGA